MNQPFVNCLVLLGLGAPSEPMVADAAAVDALLVSAPHEGLVALLGAAIDVGAIVVDEESRETVETAWAEAMARCVQLDVLLCTVSRQLAAAGIDHRALKGAAVAHLDEVVPSWRSYSDVDVLVPQGALMASTRALAWLQLRPLVQPVSERWAERFAKSLTLVGPEGTQVDLHRQLSPGVFGERLQMTALFERSADIAVGDAVVPTLEAAHRFLHACYHASLGGVRGARHRRDILLLARSVPVAAVSARWVEGWSSAVVADALDFAAGHTATLPDDWAEWRRSLVVDAADRSLLATYSGTFGDQAVASVRARGPWAAAQYAWPLLWPSRAHLRSRGRSRRQHLSAVLRPRVLQSMRSRS